MFYRSDIWGANSGELDSSSTIEVRAQTQFNLSSRFHLKLEVEIEIDTCLADDEPKIWLSSVELCAKYVTETKVVLTANHEVTKYVL